MWRLPRTRYHKKRKFRRACAGYSLFHATGGLQRCNAGRGPEARYQSPGRAHTSYGFKDEVTPGGVIVFAPLSISRTVTWARSVYPSGQDPARPGGQFELGTLAPSTQGMMACANALLRGIPATNYPAMPLMYPDFDSGGPFLKRPKLHKFLGLFQGLQRPIQTVAQWSTPSETVHVGPPAMNERVDLSIPFRGASSACQAAGLFHSDFFPCEPSERPRIQVQWSPWPGADTPIRQNLLQILSPLDLFRALERPSPVDPSCSHDGH